MKQVGVLKKQPRTWCLALSKAGMLNVGYSGEYPHPLNRAAAEAIKNVEEAKAYLIANSKPPEPTQKPKFYSLHDKTISDEDRAITEAWNKYQNDYAKWHQSERLKEWIVYDKLPIFEADLIFAGYSKGQSSFTLDFVLPETGQKISFGPKNTGELIDALIQERGIKRIDMTGQLGVPTYDNAIRDAEGRCIPQRAPYTGLGLRMKFTFTKQGKNIYAQLVEE